MLFKWKPYRRGRDNQVVEPDIPALEVLLTDLIFLLNNFWEMENSAEQQMNLTF